MPSSEYIEHPWIRDKTLTKRKYQVDIAENIAETWKNTLVCLPTGMGKTPLAALVAAKVLEKDMESKILFLAPTKPLVNQHRETFDQFLKIGPSELVTVTGEVRPGKRVKLYRRGDAIFATPQTIRNDLKKRRLGLEKFGLLVIDEAHHSVGAYAYPYIAKVYMDQSEKPLILALTASPGGEKSHIEEVKKNLFIEDVAIRTEKDKDVKPYIQDLDVDTVKVSLPKPLERIQELLSKSYQERIKDLNKLGVFKSSKITKKGLVYKQRSIAKQLKRGRKSYKLFKGLSKISEAIKIDHALGLLEAQGVHTLREYFKRLSKQKGKAVERILEDDKMSAAISLTNRLEDQGYEHPKMEKLKEILEEEFSDGEKKVIVFVHYRDTISKVLEVLEGIKNVKPGKFIGQAMKKGKGMTQKEQTDRLKDFKAGVFNVLVGSSVSEEGIDIPQVDTVMFYEAVPSAIRKIQRMGRTARTRPGKAMLLLTEGTRDEAYHWAAFHKEKRMKGILYDMQNDKKKDWDEFT